MTDSHPGKAIMADLLNGLDGVTDGPWWVDIDKTSIDYKEHHIHSEEEAIAFATTRYTWDAAYIARCSPDNIRAMAEYVAEIKAERDEWADLAGTVTANIHRMRQGTGQEPDDGPHDAVLSGLQAENERLRECAKFYAENWEGHAGDSGPGGNTPADPDCWPNGELAEDCGEYARNTLRALNSIEEKTDA